MEYQDDSNIKTTITLRCSGENLPPSENLIKQRIAAKYDLDGECGAIAYHERLRKNKPGRIVLSFPTAKKENTRP
jgi:hypothetical protein